MQDWEISKFAEQKKKTKKNQKYKTFDMSLHKNPIWVELVK